MVNGVYTGRYKIWGHFCNLSPAWLTVYANKVNLDRGQSKKNKNKNKIKYKIISSHHSAMTILLFLDGVFSLAFTYKILILMSHKWFYT
jgi:hypothetical protein